MRWERNRLRWMGEVRDFVSLSQCKLSLAMFRWTIRNPLHLALSSSGPSSNSPPTSSPSSPRSSVRPSNSPYPPYPPAPHMSSSARQDSMSSSITSPTQPSSSNLTPASFSTGFAMLLYSVAYLAHTQSADIPLASAAAGEVLRNLWDICCSAELGW